MTKASLFNRNVGVLVNRFWNQWLPPFIRDSKLVMFFPMLFTFRKQRNLVFKFREMCYEMSDEAYQDAYVLTEKYNINQKTDLNSACLKKILNEIKGRNVLEAGCGRGYLLEKLTAKTILQVTGTDLVKTKEINELIRDNKIQFKQSKLEILPFEDNEFDTTICTHVLEHVRDIQLSLKELRRVTSKRLIIVVPKERPYQFGFNLHLSFFPYRFSVLHTFQPKDNYFCGLIGGDWFYIEDYK